MTIVKGGVVSTKPRHWKDRLADIVYLVFLVVGIVTSVIGIIGFATEGKYGDRESLFFGLFFLFAVWLFRIRQHQHRRDYPSETQIIK